MRARVMDRAGVCVCVPGRAYTLVMIAPISFARVWLWTKAVREDGTFSFGSGIECSQSSGGVGRVLKKEAKYERMVFATTYRVDTHTHRGAGHT